jgi:hypothetical protein
VDRQDFETSRARAQRAKTRTVSHGSVTRDFSWHTGQWVWWPKTTEHLYHGWNAHGGPALIVFHRQTYWLCLGWSCMEEQGATPEQLTILQGRTNGRA